MVQSVNWGNGNFHYSNMISNFNHIIHKSEEYAEIMRWLSPLEPDNRHQGVRSGRLDGIGDWLLETNEFREWRSGKSGADKSVLFCSGNPGVGKTYLSSLVIDSLRDQARKEAISVAGLYCDFSDQQELTIANMIGAILKQLVGRGDIPEYICGAFQEGKMKSSGRGPRLPDLIQMLRISVASLPQVFICIDALDECLPKHLPDLLGSLRDIVLESPRVRVFLTGRPHVMEDIHRYFAKLVVIPISPNTDDIRHYLEMKLGRDPDPEAMSDDLRADITVFLERTSDIFLLVSLNIDAILGDVTIGQRRKKLEEMARGNGLRDAYTATLVQIKAQGEAALGLAALMWVQHSERPLRAEELCFALGVEIGSTDIDLKNIPAIRTVLESSLGLLTVETSSSTVRLIHFTLREHLSSDPTLFRSPHSAIAEVCLTYLSYVGVRDLSQALCSAPATMPLLEYASCYWGKHARREMTKSVEILALGLLDAFDEHVSAKLLLLHHDKDGVSGPYFDGPGKSTGFTGLHGVAFFGIVDMVAAVFRIKEWDINATDCMGGTALAWAARGGHKEIVKEFLELEDVNPDLADSTDRTPLSWAAGNGYEGVVKIFLEHKDVNPDSEDSSGRTPLLWAASVKDERVVKLFLERRYFVPNQPAIDQAPPVFLRIVVDVCFFIIALFFLSRLLSIP